MHSGRATENTPTPARPANNLRHRRPVKPCLQARRTSLSRARRRHDRLPWIRRRRLPRRTTIVRSPRKTHLAGPEPTLMGDCSWAAVNL
jgi:hypothetical protein